MALRLIHDAARVGLHLRGIREHQLMFDGNAVVPSMSYLDARSRFAVGAAGGDGELWRGDPNSATPLTVLIHGLGSSVITWSRVFGQLANAAPLVAPDLPGYGRTALPDGKSYTTLEDKVEVVRAFIDAIAPSTPVHLVGQSMGGWVAARLTAEHPHRVCRLTLINSAGILTPQVFEQRRLFTPRDVAETKRLWQAMWHTLPPGFHLLKRQYLKITRDPAVRGFLDSVEASTFLNDLLPKIEAPTLLLWGLSDELISYESVRVFRDNIPDLRVRLIPNCGHIPQREDPQSFLRYVLPWLAGAEPPEVAPPGAEAAAGTNGSVSGVGGTEPA